MPILISLETRKDYIEALIQYQLEAGVPVVDREFIQHGESLAEFKAFCFENWKQSLNIVDRTHQRQVDRNETAARAHGVDRDSDKYR